MKKSVIIIASVIIVLIGSGIIYKAREQSIKQEKLEKRFDKFMSMFYPYLVRYSNDIDLYTRMQISLMVDYRNNHKGRYIYENVDFYDGGRFSLRNEAMVEQEIRRIESLSISMFASPIEYGPRSRITEKRCFYHIFSAGRQIKNIYIYETDKDERDIIREYDKIKDEVRATVLKLQKYEVNNNEFVDPNQIPDKDYDLENY